MNQQLKFYVYTYALAFQAYRAVRDHGDARTLYKIARSAEGRAFRLVRGGVFNA